MNDSDYHPIIQGGQGRPDDFDGAGIIAWGVCMLCIAGLAFACWCVAKAFGAA